PDACPDAVDEADHRANAIRRGFVALLESRGVDGRYGRTLPRLLREAGLCDVGAHAFFPLCDPAPRRLEEANVTQVAGALVDAGFATADDIDRHLADVASGAVDVATPPLV